MSPRTVFLPILAFLACLLWAGCDSKNPLSDPAKSKPDARLAGLWRFKAPDGDVEYYHVGRAGDKLPESVMLLVGVTHEKNGHLKEAGVMLLFPTLLGSTAFLNVGADCSTGQASTVGRFKGEGWKPGVIDAYSIFRYRVEGDTLLLWAMAEDAKKQAITSGKIKGVAGNEAAAAPTAPGAGPTKTKSTPAGEKKQGQQMGPSHFTDTTENVARFVAAAGDSLFEKEPKRLERVK